MDMDIKIMLLRDGARLPERGSVCAAGADLYACLDGGWVDIEADDTVLIPTGIAAEIPEGYAGLILARSGLATNRDLAPANKVGLIDSDYRGEIVVALRNHGAVTQTVSNGERVAQLVIVPYVRASYVPADSLSSTDRGSGGFGSTGSL